MAKLVLIVDDDPTQRRILEETIKRLGYDTKTAQGGEQALQILEGAEKGSIALVLLDLVMPGMDGMEVLRRIAPMPASPPVIVQTAHGSIDTAITAMRAGAVDFVIKPTSAERLEVSIKSALKIEALQGEISRIKKKAEGTLTFADLVLRGEAMQRVITLGRRAAASNIPVLIEGESGVGKELIARAIQGESDRKSAPFVVVNCGAIPENLVESILFGHEKGCVHRRRRQAHRQVPGSRRRHAVPRRGRRAAARRPGEAAARAAGRRDRSGRVQEAGPGQLPADLGDQPRHDPAGQGRQVPRGPLLPPQRVPDLGAAPARSARGRAGAGAALPGALRRRGRPPRHRRSARRRCSC